MNYEKLREIFELRLNRYDEGNLDWKHLPEYLVEAVKEQQESIPIEPPVMPFALVKVVGLDNNGNIGQFFLVREYNDEFYQVVRIDVNKFKFRNVPTLISKKNCQIILQKA